MRKTERMIQSSKARGKRKDTKKLKVKLDKSEFANLRRLREKNKKIKARQHAKIF